MKKQISYVMGALLLALAAIPSLAAETDAAIKKYCEEAAQLMQLPPEKSAAYVVECSQARKEEMAEEK